MCTVTWIQEDSGYQLLCNRDEKRTRKPALAPSITARDGVRILCPIDGDCGGTWIGTNEFGVSVCLLNGTNCHVPHDTRSRGLLALDLIPLPSVASICEHIRAADLSVFAPFTVVALEPRRPAALVEWNGLQKSVRFRSERRSMLTSSSFDPDGVRKMREEAYALSASPLEFHHRCGANAYSPCMHRPDAATVSFSWIRVADLAADFYYTPAAPCERAAGVSQRLTRAVPACA